MTNDAKQIADAFKLAGEALLELGQLFAKSGADDNNSEKVSSRRKRVIKDKNAPKKNYSSYLHFCDEQRPQLAKEHPTFNQPELAKLLGEMWKALSDEDKKPYQEVASQDKERYDQEMANYTPPDLSDVTAVMDKKVKTKSTKPTAAKSMTATTPEPVTASTVSTTEKKSGDKDKKKKKKDKKKNRQ
ncbi:high mobility group box domain-containing protein [Absidia repens]|uniref:High mobility group box domain-containing protein n=1 Tax=Absidia repens TaxID=90262 RepID=A0A1X2IKY3_9FUNG|nr:high mobility group box domain-containing protein [Absidia repens]